MNAEAMTEFFKNADQPNNVRHKIHLLRNLRKLKNQAARQNIQMIKSQTLRMMEENTHPALVPHANDIKTELTKIVNEISTVFDTESSNRESEQLPKQSLISSFDDSEPNLESGIAFLKVVERLGTLYNTSQESAFFRQQEQFAKIMMLVKKNDTPDNEVEHLRAELLKLRKLKNTLEGILAG